MRKIIFLFTGIIITVSIFCNINCGSLDDYYRSYSLAPTPTPEIIPTPDTESPTNDSWTTSGVILSASILTTTFSEPMDQSTVEDISNYTINYSYGTTGVSITDVSYDPETNTVSITISISPEDGQIFTISSSSSILDSSGNPLSATVSPEYTAPDTTSPTNRSWTAAGIIYPETNITTIFNEPMVQSTVENTANYIVNYISGTSGVSINSIVYDPVSYTAAFTIIYGGTETGQVYTITPGSSITDLVGNSLSALTSNEYTAPSYTDIVTITGGTYAQTDTSSNSFSHTISDFMISKYEVTYYLWYTVRTWALSNGYTLVNAGREGHDGTIGAAPTDAKNEPVTSINWRTAIVWCNAYSEMEGLTPVYYTDSEFASPLRESTASGAIDSMPGSEDNPYLNTAASGYRLPTEGEWQYAASNKGATPYNYASGASAAYTGVAITDFAVLDLIAWYGNNTEPNGNTTSTHDVSTKAANELGLYDMAGNAYEWCWDWSAAYPAGPETDYQNSTPGTTRIIRGASWYYGAPYTQVGYRNGDAPDFAGNCHGLRVVRTPPDSSAPTISSWGALTDIGNGQYTIVVAFSENVFNASLTENFQINGTVDPGTISIDSINYVSPVATITLNILGTNGTDTFSLQAVNGGSAITDGGNPLDLATNNPSGSYTTPLFENQELIYVTGGTFTQEDTSANSFTHTVSDFLIGKYEVTYELWYNARIWGEANGYIFANPGTEGHDGSSGVPTIDKHEPVTEVNWRDTIVWCNAYSEMSGLTPLYYTDSGFTTLLKESTNSGSIDSTAGSEDNPYVDWSANGYRLLTEGEWQYAASNRGATPPDYGPGGSAAYTGVAADDFDNFAPFGWFGNSLTVPDGNATESHEVGTKAPNELGIYDLAGNVWEWGWDWEDTYPGGTQTDYRGVASGTLRIYRGSSWYREMYFMQVGYRAEDSPYNAWHNTGFRIGRYP